MIDDKKIKEAANLHRFELIASMHGSTLGTPMQCFEEVVDAETDLIENSFITGAKWAINEFIKELWNPANKIPKKFNHYGFAALYILQSNHQIRKVFYDKDNMSWKNVISINEYWLYVDDLLPKEGGEQ